MSKKYDVRIYQRQIKLGIVIPKPHLWDFMGRFGQEFAINNSVEGIKSIRPIDSYDEHLNGWHVQVTINNKDEAKFNNFLEAFCKQRNMSFQWPSQARSLQE